MTSFLVGLFKFVFFILAAALSLGAVLAAFGFAVPLFDTLNHLQPLWFFGTLICLFLSGMFFKRHRNRALIVAITATGFLTSGIIIVPEFISGFLSRPAASQGAESYRLMTYNLFGRNYDMDGVAAMIGNEQPDIVALNEYFPEQRKKLHPLLENAYPHFAICQGGKRANLAVYANIPFTTRDGKPCDWDENQRSGFLAAHFIPGDGGGFTVVATQLDWPLQVSPLFGTGGILTRIDKMTARQRGQFAHLAKGLQTFDDPLLIAGDFNSTSWSYALRRFSIDNGLTRETRNLPTFPKLWYFDDWQVTPAFLPLDHVMSRAGIEVTGVHTGAAAGSDHLPVIVDFTVLSSPSPTASD